MTSAPRHENTIKRTSGDDPASVKRGDSGTVEAATEILAGRSQQRGLGRLLPFLGPAFIASIVVYTLRTLPGERATAARLLPGTASALLDLTCQGAEEYMGRHVAGLQAYGLSVTAEVYRGDPAAVIVETARRVKADAIVLGTHGKTGIDAFWSGSVAPKVSGQSHVPLLLVPVT